MADATGSVSDVLRQSAAIAPHSSSSPAWRRLRWERRYSYRLLAIDTAIIIIAVGAAQFLRFGTDAVTMVGVAITVPYGIVNALLIVTWLAFLAMWRTRDIRVIIIGTDEYQRVFRAAAAWIAFVCLVIFLLHVDPSRIHLVLVFVFATAGTLLARWISRRWLARNRADGRFRSQMLLVGTPETAKTVAQTLEADVSMGLRAVGLWSPGATVDRGVIEANGHSIPVFGTDDGGLLDALRASRADTVVVTDTEGLGYDGLNELGWTLDGTQVRLLVAPHILDVTGPRIHVGSLANMPVLHLAEPQYQGANGFAKGAFDRLFAAAALVAAIPVLLASAIAIKLTSPGPVFYRQVRLGRDGEPFIVYKLRTMRENAEEELPALMAAHDLKPGELFKLPEDPRVTAVGRLLRRWSVDEIPQFINVVRGDMSIVGPRPSLPTEVTMFHGRARHRLRVRPGITGLWQVSGRADLESDEAVRLDLQYVENWSMFRDLQIVWRTVLAVLRRDGAY